VLRGRKSEIRGQRRGGSRQQAEDKRKKAGFLLVVRGPLGEKHKAWGIGERLGTKH